MDWSSLAGPVPLPEDIGLLLADDGLPFDMSGPAGDFASLLCHDDVFSVCSGGTDSGAGSPHLQRHDSQVWVALWRSLLVSHVAK